MRRRTRAGVIALALFASPVSAHDFWLQPDAWHVDVGERIAITMMVGHGVDRQRSRLPAERIVRFDVVAPDDTKRAPALNRHAGADAGDADLRCDSAGSYLVVLESDDRALSTLPAVRFNAYLREEGLTAAITHRDRMRLAHTNGSERYSRHAKTIVDCGARPADASKSHLTSPVGLALELVPQSNPSTLAASESLAVVVLDQGVPLPGALVKLNDLSNDARPIARQRSDVHGVVRFVMPRPGAWQLNVVWTHALPATAPQAFDTMFSSLAFSVSSARRP